MYFITVTSAHVTESAFDSWAQRIWEPGCGCKKSSKCLNLEREFFIAELRERVERLESRRGAKQQLRALDARTAELKVSAATTNPCEYQQGIL